MQVAGRTNDSAGDGTTTASILARDMIQYGLQAVSAGMNPVPIKKGIDATVEFLEKQLEERATPVTSGSDIKAVATISAGNDAFVGNLIAEALDKVGKDGVLTIETSSGLETTVDVTEGMEIDRGYISPQFITNQEKMLVEFENCRVLVTDHKIDNIKQLVPILEQVRLCLSEACTQHPLFSRALLLRFVSRRCSSADLRLLQSRSTAVTYSALHR